MANTFLIKVSKVTALNTQCLGGFSTKETLRMNAERIESVLRARYPMYGVKKEYCQYNEMDGRHMGCHFTLL